MKLIDTILLLGLFFSTDVLASENFTNRLQGDLGLFVNVTSSPIATIDTSTSLLPYAYFEYGRIVGRIDTFGIKTLPLGYGYLELVGRIRQDGFHAEMTGIAKRENSAPVGLGTFQVTPLGGLFLYALYDASSSQGNIYEAIYVAKFALGKVTIYPQLGFEHLSSDYTRYFYGVSASESELSGYASYDPTASTNPFLCALFEIPIGSDWFTNIYLRRKWLGSAVTDSPLVNTHFENNGFVSIAYRFK